MIKLQFKEKEEYEVEVKGWRK